MVKDVTRIGAPMKHEQALAGRREPLTAERVYRAGVELAARDGFASLTMRKLAKELGVGAMSLYHYVPSRDSLIDGMIDLVFEQIEPPSLEIGWKEAMRARALSSLRLRDAVLGCLRQGGFSVEMTVQAYSVQDAYIYGFALQEISLGIDDAEGAAEMARGHVDEYETAPPGQEAGTLAQEYPFLAEVVGGHVAKVGFDLDAAFEFGLDLILAALDQRRDEA
jgi:AcrR family transcriptional regulator